MRKMPHSGEKTPIRYADPSYTDPNYAQTVEIFDNLSHREIHDGVQLMNPVVLAAGQQAWQDSSTGLATAVEQAHSEIRAAMADGWRGAAADSAADAVREFERQGQQLADVMAAVGQRIGQAGDAAEALRAAVVEPSGQTTDLAGALLDPTKATENTATQKSADGTRQDVVQAMDSIYTNVFISTGSGVPAFPDAVTADVPQSSGTTPAAQVATMPVLDTGTQTLTTPTASITAPVPTTPHTTVEPAAATTQPAAAPTTVTPVSTAAGTTPAAAKPVVPTADSPASTTPAAATTTPTTTSDRSVRTGTAAPVTTPASTSVVAPTVPGASNTDDERKRDERKRDASGDAINGVGAGAVGGLMGGAMVAGDSPRSGMSTSAAAARAQAREEDEYDDDYHFFDDDLTFLEPADDGGELIGDMDPTTPPVVGEWTELE